MMRIPTGSSEQASSPYEKLGLRDLPFPTVAVSDPYSTDPRRNGAIYAEGPVRPNIEKFEQLLIRPRDFQNRVRLAYLWSQGDVESSRGMGKTALLRYFRQRINQDWGYTEFDGQFSALVVYVSFPSQVDRRFMEQLALSGLVDICKSEILEASRAALRSQHLSEQEIAQIVADTNGSQDLARLLDDEVLQTNGIDVTQLDRLVANQLVAAGIHRNAAAALGTGGYEDYLKSFRRDGNLEPFYVPRDTKILDYSRAFLFNDMVLYLRAAGFAGGYLFIDDIENLVDQMARRHRIEFAKEFALATVRPGYANTAHGFFSCVLATHQAASVGLAAAWGEAGLAGVARLDPNDPNSIELPLPNTDQARDIVVAHIDHYRMNPEDSGSIKPFTQDGMAALLKNRQHPRILLTAGAEVVRHAVAIGNTTIDAACVAAVSEGSAQSVPDFTEGIDGAF